MELITQVDENNNVIGKRPKKDFINSNFIHRASHLLLFNKKNNKILLQKRSSIKDIFPNLYTFAVGGTVAYDEIYEETLEREMKEEIGISVSYERLFEYKSFQKVDKSFKVLFKAQHDGPFQLEENTIDSVLWISITDLRKDLGANPEKYTPPFVEGMKIYFEKYNGT